MSLDINAILAARSEAERIVEQLSGAYALVGYSDFAAEYGLKAAQQAFGRLHQHMARLNGPGAEKRVSEAVLSQIADAARPDPAEVVSLRPHEPKPAA